MGLLIRKSLFAEVEKISRSYVSQLIRLGVLKPKPSGLLDAKEAIESLYAFRHRPKKKFLRNASVGDLNIDIGGLIKNLAKEGKQGTEDRSGIEGGGPSLSER